MQNKIISDYPICDMFRKEMELADGYDCRIKKSIRGIAMGNIDLLLEIKGFMTLVFHSVCRLQIAYDSGNHAEKQEALRCFKRHKDFFVGQVEHNDLNVLQKLYLYQEMYNVCLLILKHNHDFAQINKVILRATNHYLVRIMETIDKLEQQLETIKDIEIQISLKEDYLQKLKKLRNRHRTIDNGIEFSEIMMREQIKELKKRLEKLQGV